MTHNYKPLWKYIDLAIGRVNPLTRDAIISILSDIHKPMTEREIEIWFANNCDVYDSVGEKWAITIGHIKSLALKSKPMTETEAGELWDANSVSLHTGKMTREIVMLRDTFIKVMTERGGK